MRQLVRDSRVIVAAVLIIVLTVAGAIGGSWWVAIYAANSSQHKWCTTLNLLTSKPVPMPSDPAANPSRENAYVFYLHLKELEHDFGCGSSTP